MMLQKMNTMVVATWMVRCYLCLLLPLGVIVQGWSFSPFMNNNNNNNMRTISKSSFICRATTASLTTPTATVNGDSTASMDAVDDDNFDGSSMTATPEIRLNVFEKAKTVTSVCTSGTLSTISTHEGIEGAPFGSFIDYVLDDDGNPVLLMNEMSMHTINIQQAGDNAMVTLFTQLGGDGSSGATTINTNDNNKVKEMQDVSRCSLTGIVQKIPATADDMDTIRMRYSITHSYADQVMDSPKFAFYRLIPQTIYFVGGFGVSSQWVDVHEYRVANPDILAKEASDIVARINREHVEDLKLTAQQFLMEVSTTPIERITATNVDRLGMDLRVTYQKASSSQRRSKFITDEFRIGFRIPVVSVEDAKSEILKVFQEAWEKGNGYSWGEEEPGDSIPIMKIAEDSLE